MILSLIRQHPRLAAAIGAALVLIGVVVVGGVVLRRPLLRSAASAAGLQPQPARCGRAAHASTVTPARRAARSRACRRPTSAWAATLNVDPEEPRGPERHRPTRRLLGRRRNPSSGCKVTLMADFVQFKHRPHMAAGVSLRDLPRRRLADGLMPQAYNLNMGFCITCHRAQQPARTREAPDRLRHVPLLKGNAMTKRISRRQFFQLGALTGTAVAVSGCTINLAAERNARAVSSSRRKKPCPATNFWYASGLPHVLGRLRDHRPPGERPRPKDRRQPGASAQRRQELRAGAGRPAIPLQPRSLPQCAA